MFEKKPDIGNFKLCSQLHRQHEQLRCEEIDRRPEGMAMLAVEYFHHKSMKIVET